MIKSILGAFVLLMAIQTTAQNNKQLETNYMNCMCSLFDDNGTKFKSLIQKAEQTLINAEVLEGTSGKNYITLYKNIRTSIDGRVASFGLSDYVVSTLLDSKNVKKYSICMDSILKNPNFKNSKLEKIITLSSSGKNQKITDLTSKMLEIFEAKDFEHAFYKYLTFSLIDKFNAASKKK